MRRRIVFGTGGLLVIALLWWIISGIVGFVGGIFSPAAAPTASAPVIVAGAPCAPGTVQVIAGIGDSTQTSQASFAKGENPFVWFSLTNNGTVACTFDAGSSVSFYSITSGSETIWDSHDCDRSADASAVITLQPGETQKSGASTWLRVYSSSTGCSTGQTPVAGNGASYHLQATVNGVISNDVQFVLN
jgi:hypothetical protein